MNFSQLLGRVIVTSGLIAGAANATVIDFESLSDGTSVDNAYSGVTFSNAMVLSAGISLNEFEFPPFSGQNVAFDNGGEITIDFAAPITQLSAYFTYLMPVSMTAYDGAMNVVGTDISDYLNNLALSGDAGSLPNELLQVAYAGGISHIVLAGDPVGSSFVFDDLAYMAADNSNSNNGQIPEPATLLLLGAGLLGLAASRYTITNIA